MIENLNNKLKNNVYSVYDYDGLSMQDLLSQFFTRINECIDLTNNNAKLVEWMKSEGLSYEVATTLLKWKNEGILESLINETLFQNLSEMAKTISVTVEKFGAVGDGVTDDSDAIQLALNWSKETGNVIHFMDKRYYITKPLNISSAKLRSLSNKSGDCDVLFLQKKDKTYLKGSPNWNYLFNLDSLTAWRTVINEVAHGCCIVSDKDITILNGDKIDIEGIAIIGNHKQKCQVGISDFVPSKYSGNKHNIQDVKVIGCGSHGITLYSGFEVSNINNLVCKCNMGHGLYTGYNTGIDSATEYLTFNNCEFSHNRLNGIFFSYWRKDINFNHCNFNGNGQYYVNQVDNLLGYDRRPPATIKDVKAGVWFNKGNVDANNTNIGLSFKGCYGEDCIKGVHINNIEGVGVVNSVILENNIFYKGSVPFTGNGSCFYVNVNYISNWKIKGNYGNALDVITFEKIPNDGGNNEIFDAVNYPMVYNQELKSEKDITSKKRIYGNGILFRDIEGLDGNLVRNDFQTDFTATASSGTSNLTAMYTLTGHWQAPNADNFGGYLLIITKMSSGKYRMITLPFSSVEGFSSAPSVNDNGVLTIPARLYYRYTLTRIDNIKTN